MMNTDSPQTSAYHEAGHAVALLALGQRVLNLKLATAQQRRTGESGGTYKGAYWVGPGESDQSERAIGVVLTVAAAGAVAECDVFRCSTWAAVAPALWSAKGDFGSNLALLRAVAPESDPKQAVEAYIARARIILSGLRPQMEALAAALLERGELDEQAILAVVGKQA